MVKWESSSRRVQLPSRGGPRVGILADVAERVALWDEFRTDAFQGDIVRLLTDARARWRDKDGELPPQGADPRFDALMGLAEAADRSPLAARDAAARVPGVAEDVRLAR